MTRLPYSPPFSRIEQIKQNNERAGQFFFEPGTMRFFGSRVGRTVYGGRFFLTSEQREYNTQRRYSVRMACPDGSIESVSAFMAHPSRSVALNLVRRMLRHLDGPSDDVIRIRHAAQASEDADLSDEDGAALMAARVLEIDSRDDDSPGSFHARLALSRALDAKRDALGDGPGSW